MFVSSDRSRSDQLSYMREAHGPWPAVPQGSPLAQALSSQFSIRGIPALVAVNAADASVISANGRQEVMSMGANAFLQWESLSKGPAPPIDTSVCATLRDDNPEDVGREATEILIKLLKNVLRNPDNIKYRSVKLSNPKIESKLLPASGAFEVLFSVGFEEATDSLVLPLTAPIPTIQKFHDELEKLLRSFRHSRPAQAQASASGPSSSSASSSAAPGRVQRAPVISAHRPLVAAGPRPSPAPSGAGASASASTSSSSSSSASGGTKRKTGAGADKQDGAVAAMKSVSLGGEGGGVSRGKGANRPCIVVSCEDGFLSQALHCYFYFNNLFTI